MSSPEYQSCKSLMGQYVNVLDEGIHDMIFEVNEMDSHTEYKIIDNRIGYKIGDRYQFNATQGYLTQFAYLRELEESQVTEDAVLKNIGLLIKCGSFSYAEIPRKFHVILGVTGTLKQVSKTQKKIMVEQYDILRESFMPSVFGDNILKFRAESNFVPVQQE